MFDLYNIYKMHKELNVKEAFIAGIELGEKNYKEDILNKVKQELDSKHISSGEVEIIFRIFPELCKS